MKTPIKLLSFLSLSVFSSTPRYRCAGVILDWKEGGKLLHESKGIGLFQYVMNIYLFALLSKKYQVAYMISISIFEQSRYDIYI